MNDDFKIFTDLIGSLIAKYADKIDLDSLPDAPKYVEKISNEEKTLNCWIDSLAS